MPKKRLFLFMVIILGFFLRFYKIGEIPDGFYSDEASYGYNAYSIMKTGRDEYGESLPIAFKSFGDYKAPLYIYFTIPFIYFFGLTESAVRIPSALLSLILVYVVYILALIITKNNKISLLTSFFTAVSPFGLQFGRMAHENNLSTLLIILGIIYFLKKNTGINLILSAVFFSLSVYAYHDAKIIMPFAVFFLTLFNIKTIKKYKTNVMIAVILGFVILLPFLSTLSNQKYWSRAANTSIFSDQGTISDINMQRGESIKLGFPNTPVFHNRINKYIYIFTQNYFSHFSFDFLFLNGDHVKIYQTVNNGLIHLALAPVFFLGFTAFFLSENKYKKLTFFLLMITPLASSLTRFVPSGSRTLLFLPVFSIFTAYGLLCLVQNKQKYVKYFSAAVLLLLVYNVGYYLHSYYFNTRIRYAREWHFGTREAVLTAEKLKDSYENVWFSKNVWGYIYPLFYLKFPPENYQKQASLSPLNEYGFGWVKKIDNFIFDDFPLDLYTRKNTLFVGDPHDFPKGLNKPLYTIYYPDGNPAFYFADYNSMSNINVESN